MKKVAVIGLGNIATRHRRNLKQLFPNTYLFSMSASGRVPKEPISDADQIVNSISELINHHVELVVVASPAPFHAAHALPLIKAGIPVLIEKPITTSLKEAKELDATVSYYKTPVAIGYCLRYLPSAKAIKQAFNSKVIGNLYHAKIEIGQYLPDWRPDQNYHNSVSARAELGGGALLELSHEIDYAHWLLGELSLEHAILRKTQELCLDVEDSADLMLSTQQKSVISIHLDFLQRKAYRQSRFVGSEGVLEWDLIGNELHLVTQQTKKVLYSNPHWDRNEMYLAMLEDFIAKIQGYPNQCVSISDAAKSIALIEQIKTYYPINQC